MFKTKSSILKKETSALHLFKMDLNEEISSLELALAQKLKSFCTPFGDERESKLRESADTLFAIGKLYVNKAENTDGMLQKLTFIKCSALLNGVNVRYKILNNVIGQLDVIKMLRNMHTTLLKACRAEKDSLSLFKISKVVSHWLKSLRCEEKTNLQNLSAIAGERSETNKQKEQLKKIDSVKKLMHKNTDNYIEIMSYISDKCVKILGEAPCKFCVVGLGSLARSEITLYSDFEHVIILQEGIQYSPDYHSIQEYFRWFTVIFQVIIIGIGETFIRSVGVKSFNDLYSKDKSKNWFYDVFTPSGVSFDGRVPHSCNTPLGRQEPTEEYPDSVELIQPALKMVTFLLPEEHLKHGFYLKDLLARTCLVYGDKDIYKLFHVVSKWVLDVQRSSKEEFSKSLRENMNLGLQGKFFVLSENHMRDIKGLFYRPLTALLACIDRLQNYQSVTTWETISSLMETEIISVEGAQKLTYAFAIACELRMKLYALYGNQRQKLVQSDIVQLVGKENALHCAEAYAKFHSFIRPLIYPNENLSKVPTRLLSTFDRSTVTSLYILGYWEDAARHLLRMLKVLEENSHLVENLDPLEIRFELAAIYSSLCQKLTLSRKERDNLMNQVEYQLSFLEGSSIRDYDTTVLLCSMYLRQGQYKKVVEIYDKKSVDSDYVDFKPLFSYAMSIVEAVAPEKALEFCQKRLLDDQDGFSQMCFTYGVAAAKIKLGKKLNKNEVAKLVALAEGHVHKLGEEHIPIMFTMLFSIPSHSRDWDNARPILYLMDKVRESRMISLTPLSVNDEVYLMCLLECYTRRSNIEKNVIRKLFYILKILKAYHECRSRSKFVILPEKYIATHYITSWAVVASMSEDVLRPHFVEIARVISQAPNDLRALHTVSIDQAKLIFKILFDYEEQVRKGNLFKICSEMAIVLSLLSNDISHPLYLEVMPTLRERICSKFLDLWDGVKTWKHVKEGPAYFWKDLVRNNLHRFFRGAQSSAIIKLMNTLVITHLVQCLWQTWENFTESYVHAFQLQHITKYFNSTVKDFQACNFKKSASGFWRILNFRNIENKLKQQCLIMFIDSIVLANSSHLLIKI